MNSNNIYIKECIKHKFILACICTLIIIETLIIFKLPFMMEKMNSQLFTLSASTFRTFIVSFGVYIFYSLIQISISFILNIMYKYLSNSITSSIVTTLFKKIYWSKTKWPSQFTIDEIMQTVNGDAYKLGDKGIKIVFQIVRLTINTAGLLYYMLSTNIFLACLIVSNFLVVMFLHSKINKLLACQIKKMKQIYGKYSYTSNSFFSNYLHFRQIQAGNYFASHLKKDMDSFLKESFSIEKTASLSSVFGSISNLLNTMILMGVGAYMLVNVKISLAILITFGTYGNIFGSYLSNIPQVFIQMKEFKISYKRVKKIYTLNCHEEISQISQTDTEAFTRKIESIRLRNIQFSYNESNMIFSNFNCAFHKGQIYCIVGDNGTGKTTLINIMLGEYPVTSGKIEINNSPFVLSNCLKPYSKHVAYCPSSHLMFNDTVKNNLLLECNINENEISPIMDELGITQDSALSLTNYVDAMNTNLSDGQKQKISILRSILQNKEVMIFDEIETNLDSETKIKLMHYLNKIKKDRIIIIVSHDQYIADQSDITIRLNNQKEETHHDRIHA